MTQALYFIIKTLAQLYLLLLLLRFWLPWLRADFRNPVAQGILRFTSPLILPLRRVLPSISRLDTATVLVAFVIQFLTLLVLLALANRLIDPLPVAVTAVVELVILSLNLFFFAILIRIVLSWIAPHNYNPITALLTTLSEPILAPFRRLIPAIGGLDISPVFAIILIQALVILLHSLKPVPI
ncbi:MAG TPA: YggT family protein [Woeseiaceae bacterium]|nr:YggT family protein [Woeseiaceae bacterium]